jgi:hypothetical protein
MTKKRFALIAVLPLTVAVILGVLAMLPPHPGVSKANFDRIKEGMAWEEVDLMLGGGPPEPGFKREGDPRAWAYWSGEDRVMWSTT